MYNCDMKLPFVSRKEAAEEKPPLLLADQISKKGIFGDVVYYSNNKLYSVQFSDGTYIFLKPDGKIEENTSEITFLNPEELTKAVEEAKNNSARSNYFDLLFDKKKDEKHYEDYYKDKENGILKEYQESKKRIVSRLLTEGGGTGKIEAQDFLLKEIEEKRKFELKNGLVGHSERIIAGISKGIEKWDSWGKETGFKGYMQRLGKTATSLAIIGAVSGFSIEKIAKHGFGSASSLGGGVTSYLGKRMGFGSTISAIMASVPEDKRKWVSGALIAGSAGITLAGGGVFAAGALVASSAIGLTLTKLAKKYQNRITEDMEKAKHGSLSFKKLEEGMAEMEKQMEEAIKAAEKRRVWGKVMEGAIALGGSVAALEVMGLAHDVGDARHAYFETKNHPHASTESAQQVHENQQTVIQNNHHAVSQNHVDKIPEDTIVHKGEGIENVFIRQIEHDPKLAQSLGFHGKPEDLHAFAQREAHVLAFKEGYVDNKGHEIYVSEGDKVAYEIKVDNGHAIIEERSVADNSILNIPLKV